jgi:hypothetical protein
MKIFRESERRTDRIGSSSNGKPSSRHLPPLPPTSLSYQHDDPSAFGLMTPCNEAVTVEKTTLPLNYF